MKLKYLSSKRSFIVLCFFLLAIILISLIFLLCIDKNCTNKSLLAIGGYIFNYHASQFIYTCLYGIEIGVIMFFIIRKKPSILYCICVSVFGYFAFVYFYNWPMYVFYSLVIIGCFIYPLYFQEYRSKNYWKIIARTLFAISIAALSNFVLQYTSFLIGIHHHLVNSCVCLIIRLDYIIILFLLFLFVIKGIEKLREKKQKNISVENQDNAKRKLLKKSQIIVPVALFSLTLLFPFMIGQAGYFLIMFIAFIYVRVCFSFNYYAFLTRELICFLCGNIIFGIACFFIPNGLIGFWISAFYGVILGIAQYFSRKLDTFFIFRKLALIEIYQRIFIILDGQIIDTKIIYLCKSHLIYDDESINILVDFMNELKIKTIAKDYGFSKKYIYQKLNYLCLVLDKVDSN